MSAVTTPTGITLEYEAFGNPSDPPLLLVMGFTAQLISWPEGFCRRLADGGRYVIRFDNRDCGLSTKFDGQIPDMAKVVGALASHDAAAARAIAPYTLSDMSDDAFGLLSALNIERAHIVGASMGGMIVQTMAIEHPERVLTMTSIMSTTGEQGVGGATPEAQAALLTPPPPGRQGYIDAAPNFMVCTSKKYSSAEEAKARAAIAYDRSYYPEGASRQLAAIVASGSRGELLPNVSAPTLVIHGLDDTLIDVSGGRRTAALVPGATLLEVADMGHDLPEPLWPDLCGAILSHTQR